MAAISSKAILKTTDPYKYDAGSELEEELNYYNTFYRKYDAQIGRFTGVDIRSEESAGMSVYNFGANNPVMFYDPLGDKFGRGNQMEEHPIDANWSYASLGVADNGFGDTGDGGGGGYSAFWYGIADAFSGDDEKPNGVIIDKYGSVISNNTLFFGVFIKNEIFDQYNFIGTLGGVINGEKIISNVIISHKEELEHGEHSMTLSTFYDLVKTGGDWDLKNKPNTIFSMAERLDKKQVTLFTFGKYKMAAQDIGNFHYGVFGKAFGLSEVGLLKAAGMIEMKEGKSRPEWQTPENMRKYYGDDPRDQGWIKEGFKYFKRFF